MDESVSLDDLRLGADQRAELGGPRRLGRWLLLALLAVLAIAIALFLLFSSSPPEVEVAEVRSLTVASGGEAVLQASGYVTAQRQATVSAKRTGKVIEVLVEEGMKVEEGQVLARLDASQEQRELALADARLRAARSSAVELGVRLEEARLNLRRSRQLAGAEVVAEAQVDADQANVHALEARLASSRDEVLVAQRQVELSRQLVDDMVIRAPFAGVAISKDAQPGEMISPISAGGGFTRTGISTLVDMSSLEIEVDVNEAYINRVYPGQRATAVLDAYPDWTVPAEVITTIPAADRQKATVQVRLAFAELDPRILPDMGVKVSFLERARAEETAGQPARRLSVPRAALLREENGQADRRIAFVVDGDDRVERRVVGVGRMDGDRAEVTAGLTAGESVVLDPPADLADGDAVRIRKGE